MLPTQDTPAQMRARIARATRNGDEDEAAAARSEYAVRKLEEHIKSIIAAAPPLNQEQRDRLRTLLADEPAT